MEHFDLRVLYCKSLKLRVLLHAETFFTRSTSDHFFLLCCHVCALMSIGGQEHISIPRGSDPNYLDLCTAKIRKSTPVREERGVKTSSDTVTIPCRRHSNVCDAVVL